MTVDFALEYMNKLISQSATLSSKLGRTSSITDFTDDEKLLSINRALQSVAISTNPITLIESANSTQAWLKKINAAQIIRVPAYPAKGAVLDIDEPLWCSSGTSAWRCVWSSSWSTYQVRSSGTKSVGVGVCWTLLSTSRSAGQSKQKYRVGYR